VPNLRAGSSLEAQDAPVLRELLSVMLEVQAHVEAISAQLDRVRAQLERLDARVSTLEQSSGRGPAIRRGALPTGGRRARAGADADGSLC
jgi:hypothetical protein